MNKAQELLQLAQNNQLNTSRTYLLVVKSTPQEFKEMREELAKHGYTFSLVPDEQTETKKVVNGGNVPAPATTYSLYLTNPQGLYLVAKRGTEKWFAERGIYAI